MERRFKEFKNKQAKLKEFRDTFIPVNRTGDISMKRYLDIMGGIEKFVNEVIDDLQEKNKSK
jgi:hypothetical protein